MNRNRHEALLSAEDPPPVRIDNPSGRSTFLLLGDHAGNAVPSRLGSLGLSRAELNRHIGWDIGVAELGLMLAETLDAVFVHQTYSRLVIDCNRDPAAIDAVPETSDGTAVPKNRELSEKDRAKRVAEIHEPYQAAIADEIGRRDALGMKTVLVSLHSFTPVMGVIARPWDIGLLYDGGNTTFALALLKGLARDPALVVGDNQPYRMDDTDHTVPRHAFGSARRYAEIEIRQDLISEDSGRSFWAETLAREMARADIGSERA
jgi:predicted N-formylglutamate amidohydrolase